MKSNDIDKLQKHIAMMQDSMGFTYSDTLDLMELSRCVINEVRRLRDALEFYADKKNWHSINNPEGFNNLRSYARKDQGRRARQALAHAEETREEDVCGACEGEMFLPYQKRNSLAIYYIDCPDCQSESGKDES